MLLLVALVLLLAVGRDELDLLAELHEKSKDRDMGTRAHGHTGTTGTTGQGLALALSEGPAEGEGRRRGALSTVSQQGLLCDEQKGPCLGWLALTGPSSSATLRI